MNYLKAREISELPFLVFDLVATSEDEAFSLGYIDGLGAIIDPLVIEENWLIDDLDPDYISYEFGICHKKVVATPSVAIVDRDIAEINDAEDDNIIAINVEPANELEEKLRHQTFPFDSKVFPLTLGARSSYNTITLAAAGNLTIKATDGDYVLTDANRVAFLEAYSSAVFFWLNDIS